VPHFSLVCEKWVSNVQLAPNRAQLAKLIVDIATGETEHTISESKRHPSPKRKGGIKGGKARAKTLTAQSAGLWQREPLLRDGAVATP
jgi:hypothetical protein